MRERLPRRLQVALTAGTLAGALALAGCAPSASTPTPTPVPVSPSATAFFASGEEALAAATAAYEAYARVSDEIAASGGTDPSRLRPYVTEEEFDRQLASLSGYQEHGWHTTGATSIDSVRLEKVDSEAAEVTLYLCVDVSGVQILDSTGVVRTPTDRVERLPFEAIMKEVEGTLRVARSSVWSGDNFC